MNETLLTKNRRILKFIFPQNKEGSGDIFKRTFVQGRHFIVACQVNMPSFLSYPVFHKFCRAFFYDIFADKLCCVVSQLALNHWILSKCTVHTIHFYQKSLILPFIATSALSTLYLDKCDLDKSPTALLYF